MELYNLHHISQRVLITAFILLNVNVTCRTTYQKRPILPADSYQILGAPGFRRAGSCNYTYAWLTPPPGSSLDPYGHALACTRLQLENGRTVKSSAETESFERSEKKNMADEEMRRIDKELSASIVDLLGLDALMRAEQFDLDYGLVQPSAPIANDSRYFYLADRIDNLYIMAMLRPRQQIKLELLNTASSSNLVTPQHVLCFRKQCPVSKKITPFTNSTLQYNLTKVIQQSKVISGALSKAEGQNRELYLQLIISRIACGLLGFLCVILAVTALMLCIRLRSFPNYCRKQVSPSEHSVYRETNSSPTYFHPNGKIPIGQSSPLYITDSSPRHLNAAHLTGDTASVNNAIMTGSTCEGMPMMPGGSLSYSALGPTFGPVSPYALSVAHAVPCNNTSGQIAYMPINSRMSMFSTPRGILLPYQNGSTSPVPSNNSLSEKRCAVSRSGSLGRYSNNNYYYCYSGENGRRKVLKTNKAVPFRKHQDTQSVTQMTVQQTGIPIVEDLSINGNGTEVLRSPTESRMLPNDLISYSPSVTTHTTSVHRYPGAIHTTFGKKIEVHNNGSDERRENSTNEPYVGLIRKPALNT